MDTRLVYTSGHITGLTHGDCTDWRDYAHRRLRELSKGRIITMSPMRGKVYLDNGEPIVANNDHLKQFMSKSKTIRSRDKNDVMRCHAVLTNFCPAPQKISIGTDIEAAWAEDYGKSNVVCMPEDCVYRGHPIFNELAGLTVVPDLDSGIELVYQILRDDSF
jgi:hypothetical protein